MTTYSNKGRIMNKPQLRDYQQDLFDGVKGAWSAGHKNVLAVAPTGAGKTVLLSALIMDHDGPACVIAHRRELVEQISVALAKNSVHHTVIAPPEIINMIIQLHIKEVGQSFYDGNSKIAVASVNTLNVRTKDPKILKWASTVTLWISDEAHHVLRDNQWGKATVLFPNAKGLGVTATPSRTDGAGLGVHHDGVFEIIIEGPTPRELINRKFLTEYKIMVPSSNVDLSHARISKTTGDYVETDVKNAVASSSLIVGDTSKSQVVGDVVKTYMERFNGMLSVVFVPSVEIGNNLADQFMSQGVKARSLSANTPTPIRFGVVRQFARREVTVLINVALFDEGFDLPAIELVQDAYPTQSYGRYAQRFGRMLRICEGKFYGWYVDHAGNVMRHGLPDRPRSWTLDRRDKKSAGQSDAIPLRVCVNPLCLSPYERYHVECPYCGTVPPPPLVRSGPEFVDGDLVELDEATLSAMRGEMDNVKEDTYEATQLYKADLQNKRMADFIVRKNSQSFSDKHEARQNIQAELYESMALWAGWRRSEGLTDRQVHKMFYLRFNIDVMTAQTLYYDDAVNLLNRVNEDLCAQI